MVRVKEIKYGLTKGLPNFSAVRVELTAEINENDDMNKAFDDLKYEAEKQCSQDPSWISRD